MEDKYRIPLLMLIDSLLIFTAYFMAMLLRFDFEIPLNFFANFKTSALILVLIGVLCLYIVGVYHRTWRYASTGELLGIGLAFSIAVIFQFLAIYFTFEDGTGHHLPRSVFLIACIFQIFFVGFSRVIWQYMQSRQKNIAFSPPDISDTEIEEVVQAMKSGWITTGPRTKEFERRIAAYLGTNRSVCLNSATACMELTLRILGIGPGDEVITSAYTYTASASVIHHVGAKIVLVDTAPDSYEMDYQKLSEVVTEKTKAIIAVDLAGVMCDYDKIYEAVDKNKDKFSANNDFQNLFNRVVVIADAAHAFGAERNSEKCGSVADFTCFSFHAVKNLTTAEGGAVTWRDDRGIDDNWLYNQYMLFSLHGQSKDALSKTKMGSWEYDIIYPGYKCNMTDILASFGLMQLERYGHLIHRRKEIIEKYNKGLEREEISVLQHYTEEYTSSGHLYLVRISGIEEEERNSIISEMAKEKIPCNVHYKPLPMFKAYQDLGFSIDNYPNAYSMYKNEITLPLHTLLTNKEAEKIIETFNKALDKVLKSKERVDVLNVPKVFKEII